MEALNLLKFWRYAVSDQNNGSNCTDVDLSNSNSSFRTTTTATTEKLNQLLETDDETDDEEAFFDLVLTEPNCNSKVEDRTKSVNINSFDSDKHISKGDGEIRSNFIQSPNDVFYRRNSNSKPQSPMSLLRSPQKFRVFMLRFNKSKTNKTSACIAKSSPECHSKRFSVKSEEEEHQFPIASLFTRDNSLRSKLQREKMEDASVNDSANKYLSLIRPLYSKASKRYSDKTRFSDQHSAVSPFSSPATVPVFSPRKQVDEKQGSRASVFREVCKNLVKNRAALSSVGTPSPVAMRRDDSAMLQQDVQNAILHCKRSYSSSSQECCHLSRSTSDSSHQTSGSKSKMVAVEEEKRFSI